MSKAERIIYILTLLRNHRYLKAKDLADRCGVSERTIYRDLISISSSNIPIYYNNGYRLVDFRLLAPASFTSAEADYLLILLGGQHRYRQDKIGAISQRIIEKIKASGISQIPRKKPSINSKYGNRFETQVV
jgi:predicted DNA-binding transcriptional regulator YafY